jgi:hypothetical protein
MNGKHGALLAALVAAASPAARGQALATVDTEMTALGIVQLHGDAADSAAAWVVFLPTPVRLGSLRTNVLELEDPRAAQRYVDRFVEVRGRITIGRDGGAAYHAVVSGARRTTPWSPGRGCERSDLQARSSARWTSACRSTQPSSCRWCRAR